MSSPTIPPPEGPDRIDYQETPDITEVHAAVAAREARAVRRCHADAALADRRVRASPSSGPASISASSTAASAATSSTNTKARPRCSSRCRQRLAARPEPARRRRSRSRSRARAFTASASPATSQRAWAWPGSFRRSRNPSGCWAARSACRHPAQGPARADHGRGQASSTAATCRRGKRRSRRRRSPRSRATSARNGATMRRRFPRPKSSPRRRNSPRKTAQWTEARTAADSRRRHSARRRRRCRAAPRQPRPPRPRLPRRPPRPPAHLPLRQPRRAAPAAAPAADGAATRGRGQDELHDDLRRLPSADGHGPADGLPAAHQSPYVNGSPERFAAIILKGNIGPFTVDGKPYNNVDAAAGGDARRREDRLDHDLRPRAVSATARRRSRPKWSPPRARNSPTARLRGRRPNSMPGKNEPLRACPPYPHHLDP